MRTVSDIVRQLVSESDIASEAMRLGLLNFSAYAESIRSEVERRAWKEVKPGTITVALTRIAKENSNLPPLRPQVVIDDLKIKYPLIDISFEKTEDVVLKLSTIQSTLPAATKHVFVMTEGMSEVTIIASAELKEAIQSHFQMKPKGLFENLVGVSVSFDPSYLAVQNTIYSLTSSVAAQRVNIIELISTHTELMFVIEEKDRQTCVEALQSHFAATA